MPGKKSLPRWEIHVRHQTTLKPYLGYIRALLYEDKLSFCIIKARSSAIETAMQIV